MWALRSSPPASGAGIVAAQLTGGVLGLTVGAVVAVVTFLGLRRITGRIVAAAVADL